VRINFSLWCIIKFKIYNFVVVSATQPPPPSSHASPNNFESSNFIIRHLQPQQQRTLRWHCMIYAYTHVRCRINSPGSIFHFIFIPLAWNNKRACSWKFHGNQSSSGESDSAEEPTHYTRTRRSSPRLDGGEQRASLGVGWAFVIEYFNKITFFGRAGNVLEQRLESVERRFFPVCAVPPPHPTEPFGAIYFCEVKLFGYFTTCQPLFSQPPHAEYISLSPLCIQKYFHSTIISAPL
jgi:hypothetical protein